MTFNLCFLSPLSPLAKPTAYLLLDSHLPYLIAPLLLNSPYPPSFIYIYIFLYLTPAVRKKYKSYLAALMRQAGRLARLASTPAQLSHQSVCRRRSAVHLIIKPSSSCTSRGTFKFHFSCIMYAYTS